MTSARSDLTRPYVWPTRDASTNASVAAWVSCPVSSFRAESGALSIRSVRRGLHALHCDPQNPGRLLPLQHLAAAPLGRRKNSGVRCSGLILFAQLSEFSLGAIPEVSQAGHTDGADTRTARLPSAWHQSYEWAGETVNVLSRTLPAARLAAEGAADIDAAGAAAAPRRRVDIVLYP